jgi:hypothetical protein
LRGKGASAGARDVFDVIEAATGSRSAHSETPVLNAQMLVVSAK